MYYSGTCTVQCCLMMKRKVQMQYSYKNDKCELVFPKRIFHRHAFVTRPLDPVILSWLDLGIKLRFSRVCTTYTHVYAYVDIGDNFNAVHCNLRTVHIFQTKLWAVLQKWRGSHRWTKLPFEKAYWYMLSFLLYGNYALKICLKFRQHHHR